MNMYKFFIIIVIYFCGISGNINDNKYELLDTVDRGFKEYSRTKIRPPYLKEALKEFQIPYYFRENLPFGNDAIKETQHNLRDDVLCNLCSIAANFVVRERKAGMSRAVLLAEAIALCEILKVESNTVCRGFIDINIDIFLYLVDNNPDTSPNKFCDLIFQTHGCNFTNIEWTIDLPKGQSPARPAPTGVSTINILHVTDVHFDDMYTPGKVKNCEDMICCQSDQEDGYEGNSCGFWGEYGNDISENLLDDFIRFANTLDFNYVYFTGDVASHRDWNTTIESRLSYITRFFEKLKKGFNVPVYPILGNHEPNPVNQYEVLNQAPSNLSTSWLYELIEKEWSEWLPESTLATISKGGFYTVSPREGFRLVVLNSNVAYKYCWWLFENDEDPYDELDWLTSILSQAEAKNESVHILGHIPTGTNDIIRVWSREYNKIINRFANTITGQFNGHTHVDQFYVFFNNSDPDQAVNVAWNGASLVTASRANPSFKVYTIDAETFNVIDINEYTFNLTQANANPHAQPNWYNLYSFRDAYNVPSLQPKDIGNLLVKMATNHNLLNDYHRFRYKNSDAVSAKCNEDCQKAHLCEMSTYIMGDRTKCDYLKEIYDENL